MIVCRENGEKVRQIADWDGGSAYSALSQVEDAPNEFWMLLVSVWRMTDKVKQTASWLGLSKRQKKIEVKASETRLRELEDELDEEDGYTSDRRLMRDDTDRRKILCRVIWDLRWFKNWLQRCAKSRMADAMRAHTRVSECAKRAFVSKGCSGPLFEKVTYQAATAEALFVRIVYPLFLFPFSLIIRV